VGQQLLVGAAQVGFGFGPGAAQREHLAAVDAAQALAVGGGRGQRLAPHPSGLGPLTGALQIGQVLAGQDHRAIDPAGVQGNQLAGQDTGHRIVEQRQALIDPALGDEGATLDLHRYRRQVGVAVALRHLDGVRGTVHGLVQRSLVQMQLGFGHPQPAVLDAVGVPLEMPEAAA